MTEDFLHTIWKFKLLGLSEFIGVNNEQIKIIAIGEHNQHSGPDFFNSKISINGVVLAGNVEIHIKTSDWLRHNHQNDKAYNNLVLHVVYEHDKTLLQNEDNNVSVLELKKYIHPLLIKKYDDIKFSRQIIPCGAALSTVPDLQWNSWLDRLMISRLEEKTKYIQQLFEFTDSNYEETLYIFLMRTFGFKINNDAFELLAKTLPYSLVRKYSDDPFRLEALLFGTAGLLDDLFDDKYPKLLQNELAFLKSKHQIVSLKKESWKFSKTRPVNFPTIRLSQIAALFHKSQSLYHLLEKLPDLKALNNFFNVSTSIYWESHYTFDNPSEDRRKPLGNVAIHSLIINCIVPFIFFKSAGNETLCNYALNLLSQLPAELNSKTKPFSLLKKKACHALESQAQIQLYDHFCSVKACLHCNVGGYLLKNTI